jgi:hypothetical protein
MRLFYLTTCMEKCSSAFHIELLPNLEHYTRVHTRCRLATVLMINGFLLQL